MADDELSSLPPSTKTALLNDSSVQLLRPFDDPILRTKCLMQYIKIRKQHAENEIAKRNALRKQKKDAKATLQNARDSLNGNEEEVLRCELRLEELNKMRHELCISYKSVINKETERKRQRIAAVEEARQNEEQQRLQQQTATAAQLLGIDTLFLQQQLKNAQLLNVLASNGNVNNRVSQLISSSVNANSVATLPLPGSGGNATPVPNANLSPSPVTTTTPQSQNCLTPLQKQQLAVVAAEASLQQQLQQQNAAAVTLNFLRQQYALASAGQPSQQSVDSLRQFQQQQLLATNSCGAGTAALSLLAQQQHQQTSGQTPVVNALQQAMAGAGISPDVIYQTLLANLGAVVKSD